MTSRGGTTEDSPGVPDGDSTQDPVSETGAPTPSRDVTYPTPTTPRPLLWCVPPPKPTPPNVDDTHRSDPWCPSSRGSNGPGGDLPTRQSVRLTPPGRTQSVDPSRVREPSATHNQVRTPTQGQWTRRLRPSLWVKSLVNPVSGREPTSNRFNGNRGP